MKYFKVNNFLLPTDAAAQSDLWRKYHTVIQSWFAKYFSELQIKLDHVMIANDNELQVTLERIARMQRQVAELRHKEINPHNYRLSVSGYLAEIDRMQLDVREFSPAPSYGIG